MDRNNKNKNTNRIMADTSTIWHIPPTNDYLLTAQQEPYKKSLTPWEFLGRKLGEWTISRKMTRQKE